MKPHLGLTTAGLMAALACSTTTLLATTTNSTETLSGTPSSPATQALSGAEVNLRTLDGDLTLTIPAGSNTGDVLRVRGKGVPSERTGRRGDLLIRIHVDMPKKLSREAKRLIESLKNEGI